MRIRMLCGAVAFALTLSSCSGAGGSDGLDGDGPLRVTVLQIASADVLDETVEAFEAQLTEELAPREVEFDLKNAQGDQSLVNSLASAAADSDAHAFAVIGTPLVIALAGQERRRPIIALAMGDPVGAQVAESLEEPGGNVTGSVDFIDPAIPLEQIMTIEPTPERIGTIYDPSNPNMQTWIDAFDAAVAEYPGLEVVESTISGTADVEAAARSLAGRVDIEVIGPDSSAYAALDIIGATALANDVPTYVIAGDPTVTGILASIGSDYSASGRRAATAAAAIFEDGADPGSIPFSEPEGVEFTVNESTMTALGVTVPADLLAGETVQ